MAKNIHLVATVQTRTVGLSSEKSVNSLSQSLTPSAAAFKRAAIAGGHLIEEVPEVSEETEQDNSTEGNNENQVEKSTLAVHGDAEPFDVIKGFSKYDSSNINSPDFESKKKRYDEIRAKYPSDMKNMLRDDKVKALQEINKVGFKYCSVKVEAFTEVEGEIVVIRSKTHHRLNKVSITYLENLLKDVFNAEIRSDSPPSKEEEEHEDVKG